MSPSTGWSQSRSSHAYLRFGSFRFQKWTCVSTNESLATGSPFSAGIVCGIESTSRLDRRQCERVAGESAVDVEQVARHVRSVVAGQVEDALGDVLRPAEATQRDGRAGVGEKAGVVAAEQRSLFAIPVLEAGIRNRARSDAVDPDPVARDLEHEALREAVDQELRGRVGTRVGDAELPRDDVDDRSATLRPHGR